MDGSLLRHVAYSPINQQSDEREPVCRPARAVISPMPDNIFSYILETSGWHQLWLVVLTVIVFLLEIVPLELQRRVVNDLTKHGNFSLIVVLCAIYAGTVLLQGGIKLILNLYRSWVSERAIRNLRRRVHVLVSSSSAAASGPEAEGIQASMIVAEVESIGGFIGGSISEPLLQGGILASVLAYMIHVEIWIAGTAVVLFVPQLVFVPLMQGAINRRIRSRVQIIRQLSVSVVDGIKGDVADRTADERIQHVFELNIGVFCLKFSMNFLMNLSTQLQIIGVLLVGGWAVYAERLEIGGVVAFISAIGKITDPWGDLVNYFRDVNITHVKFSLLRDTVDQQGLDQVLDKT